MLSIGETTSIERTAACFKLTARHSVRKTILFETWTPQLCKIQERMLHIRDSMEIEGPDGKRLAMVHKAMITPLRERCWSHLEDGPDLHAQGNFVDHEYTIERDGTRSPRSPTVFRSATPTGSRWPRQNDCYPATTA